VELIQVKKKMQIERQLQGTLNTVFTELIKEKGLEKCINITFKQYTIFFIDCETNTPVFFIELRSPKQKNGISVFNRDTLMQCDKKAEKLRLQHYGICNFVTCAFFYLNKHKHDYFSNGLFKSSDVYYLTLHREFLINEVKIVKFRKIAKFYVTRLAKILDNK
jgi:hypothetical protein